MRHAVLFLFLAILPFHGFVPKTAWGQTAQEIHVSGSPNPVGSGARALGMGGAFIGVADDATAASWNPGGLIQLETPEVSCVLSFDKLFEKRSFELNPGASGEHSIALYDINYFSVAYPFTFRGTNMIVSLNYQTMYGFNKENKFDYTYQSLGSTVVTAPPLTVTTETDESGPRHTDRETDGYLKALSPAIAVQLTPSISVGLTFNFFHPDLGSKWNTDYYDKRQGTLSETITKTIGGPPVITTNTYSVSRLTEYHDKWEFRTSLNPFDFNESSYHIGFLWNINAYLTLGGVYKPSYTATIRYRETFASSQDIVNNADSSDATHDTTPMAVVTDEEQEMEMPASYGLGLACRFSDRFTLGLDIYRTDWQNFFLRQASGNEISLITGQDRSLADTKPTHQVRLGGEYLFFPKDRYVVPLRAGLFYDPEPTKSNPDDFYGFSLGSGMVVGSFVFDVAYQYRWGNHVRMVRLGTEEVLQNVRQHTIYASVIFHF